MELFDLYNRYQDCIIKGDFILVDYDLFFESVNIGKYTRFALDADNEITQLREILKRVIAIDNNSTLYVCAYGNELLDNKGERFLYGDAIWIKTSIDIIFLYQLFDNYKALQPSQITNLKCTEELNQVPMFYFTESGLVEDLSKNKFEKNYGNLFALYWD